jgi:hypothetical protein
MDPENSALGAYEWSTIASKAFQLFTERTGFPSWKVSGTVWFEATRSLEKDPHKNIPFSEWIDVILKTSLSPLLPNSSALVAQAWQ